MGASQEKSPKESTIPDQSKPANCNFAGIFRLAILARSENGGHGCALFFDQGMDALSKNPGTNDDPGLLCREKRFLWFVSLTLIKEMNSPKAKRFFDQRSQPAASVN